MENIFTEGLHKYTVVQKAADKYREISLHNFKHTCFISQIIKRYTLSVCVPSIIWNMKRHGIYTHTVGENSRESLKWSDKLIWSLFTWLHGSILPLFLKIPKYLPGDILNTFSSKLKTKQINCLFAPRGRLLHKRKDKKSLAYLYYK